MTNDIAVLLPVGIETRFCPPDADHPTQFVKVRVTPDDIAVNRHRPKPTTFERAALADLHVAWHTQMPGRPLREFLAESDAGRALWRRLCDYVTPARAAWLVGSNAEQDPAALEVDDEHRPARIGGFPDRFEVWITRRGQPAPEKIGEGPAVQRDRLVFDLPSDNPQAWWNSWAVAKEIGLGVECDLPGEPEEITALYVLGLSDDPPAQHFADKVASGDFAAVEPGAATNTVHGAPAADLARDPDTWGRIVAAQLDLAASNSAHLSSHGAALTGQAGSLPLFPGPDFDPNRFGQTLVGALYPALWGHFLKDIWGLGRDAHGLADWMFEWLRPEGHLLPIRSGDQPYGIVPASTLANWTISPAEGNAAAVEPALSAAAQAIRDRLAAQAEATGTTVDADTRRLVTLVGRTPTATGYSFQTFEPADLIELLLDALPGVGPNPDIRARFENEVEGRYRPGQDVRRGRVLRAYLASGNLRDSGLPLVLPVHFLGVSPDKAPTLSLTERVQLLVDALERLQKLTGVTDSALKETFEGVLPDSLLFRLLLQSALIACADAAQASLPNDPGGGEGPRLEPLFSPDVPALWIWSSFMSLRDSGQVDLNTPAGRTYRIVQQSVEDLIKILLDALDQARRDGEGVLADMIARLERLFKNTLDTAATRVDPFITGLAWRRLNMLSADPATRFRLGIYGWVDSPKRGQDGPLPGGLLHAPSQAQLVTSIILRDRYLAERDLDGGQGKAWQMSVTSRLVRMAEEIAEEVRMGAHVREALGRRVEAIVGDPEVIRDLRTRPELAPQHPDHPDAFTVCNGERVLDLLADGGLPPQVTAEQRGQLQEWRDAIDVYADLLVAQGVYQSVTRRADAASGAMNAAAGLGLPPELGVIQTPRAGQSLLTSVLAALPFTAMPPLPPGQAAEAHPVQLADASVAAHVDERFGPASDWRWTFRLQGQRLGAGGALEDFELQQDITLADAGLAPSDALSFSPDKLTAALGQLALDGAAAGIPGLLLSIAVGPEPVVPDPERHRLARELVAVLSGKPFAFHQLHLPDPNNQALADELARRDNAIAAELLERLNALLSAGKALRNGALADPAQAATGLRLALRWGIAPIDGTLTPAERARLAAGALDARIQKAEAFLSRPDGQGPASGAPPAPNAAGALPQAGAAQIAEAIGELAAPEGQLAILSAVDKAELQAYELHRPLKAAPNLDEDWLTVVAPVRRRMARLEAFQLQALREDWPADFQALTAFSNMPGDPWQTQPVIQNRQRAHDGQAMQPARLIVAYGPADVWGGAGEQVAAGFIDSWSETAPEIRHNTQAAFHFNAPGARAPQAVLLAVPPVLDQSLDTPAVLDIVRETRTLAHARMAALEDLDEIEAVLPAMLLSTPDSWDRALLDESPSLDF